MSACRPIYQDVREVGKTVKSYVFIKHFLIYIYLGQKNYSFGNSILMVKTIQ